MELFKIKNGEVVGVIDFDSDEDEDKDKDEKEIREQDEENKLKWEKDALEEAIMKDLELMKKEREDQEKKVKEEKEKLKEEEKKKNDRESTLGKNEMHVIAKYFESVYDFINAEKTNKEFRGLFESFYYNPISTISEKERALFKNLKTYHMYEEEGEQYQIKYPKYTKENEIETETEMYKRFENEQLYTEYYEEVKNKFFDKSDPDDIKRNYKRINHDWHEKIKMINRGINTEHNLQPKPNPYNQVDQKFVEWRFPDQNHLSLDDDDEEETPIDVNEIIDMYNDADDDKKMKVVYHTPMDKCQYEKVKEELGDWFELKKGGNMTTIDDVKANGYTEVDGVIDTTEIVPDREENNEKMIKVDLHEYGFLVKGSYWFSDALRKTFDIKNSVYEVILPPAMIELGDSMFFGCRIESIDIPASVTELGKFCFSDCRRLTEFRASSVKKVGEQCFRDCEVLKTIVLSDKIEELPEHCFCNCRKLEHLYFNNTNNVIGGDNVIPDSVKKIGRRCFHDCESLEEITIPESVIELDECFCDCSSLKYIHNNGSIKYLGDVCFSNCRKLELVGRHKKDDYQLTIDLELEIIGSGTFLHVGATSLYLPDSVKILKRHSFFHYSRLEKLHIPRELLFVEEQAFEGCENLRRLVFNRDLILIESDNFEECNITIEVPKTAHVNIKKENVKVIRYDDSRKIDDEDETKMEITK